MKNIFKKEAKEEKNIVFEVMKYVIPIIIAILIFIVIKFGILNRTYEIENLDVNKYTSLVTGSSESLIFFRTDECPMCDSAADMFKKVLKGSDIKLYQLEINNLTDEEKDIVMNLLDITKEGIEAPLLINVKESQVVSLLRVPYEEDTFVQYLKDNNLTK